MWNIAKEINMIPNLIKMSMISMKMLAIQRKFLQLQH